MAWMAMMGADSVDYHRVTVMGRPGDHSGDALAYYGSRGETPLVWGGEAAHLLGLAGQVTPRPMRRCSGRAGPATPQRGCVWWRPDVPGWSCRCRCTSRWPSWG